MALHSSLLTDRQRELVPNKMMYPVEAAGLLGTSKIMQYKAPDFGKVFSGEDGNNVIRFTANGPGLMDPRSLYIQYSMRNVTPIQASAVPTANTFGLGGTVADMQWRDQGIAYASPGSYSPFKRVRILSGFNQQVLYDCDGYNVMCAFLDDYQKSIHDLVMDGTGFYAVQDGKLTATKSLDFEAGSQVYDRNGSVDNEYLNWCFKPRLGCAEVDGTVDIFTPGLVAGQDNLWKSSYAIASGSFPAKGAVVLANVAQAQGTPDGSKLFTLCDLPYVGLLSQGKYLPLWGLGGIIIELYLDQAANWCSLYDVWSDGSATITAHDNFRLVPNAASVGPIVQFDDIKLYYDNIIPPADFLEGLKMQINSPDGLSLIFPSVNRHLATIPALVGTDAVVPQFFQRVRNEVLIADHSRMAQSIFQIFRPQNPIAQRRYKLHNRTSAALASWQLKLNSAYIPQQPLEAVGNTSATLGADGKTLSGTTNFSLLQVRQYGQFHRELLKALGQQRRPLGSVTPSQYELITDGNNASPALIRRDQRGAFAIGIDLTVSDDVMTGTNLRNATVTGEMFANIERYVHPGATATEVQTFVMKLSQIRMTAAGPIVVD
jgi:hypothetical protein